MSCPLFLPESRLVDFAPTAMPLGDCYSGHCAGNPGVPVPIDTLRACCNIGYARGTCERAAQAEADAVRFTIKADTGAVLEIAWALERNHHPLAVGSVKLPRRENPSAPLERQLQAYAEAYLRAKGRE